MPTWPIRQFNGGLSDSKEAGIEHSFAYGVGLNIHKNPRALEVNQALKKDSGTVITDLVIKIIKVGSKKYGFGNAGNVYKKESGTWSKIYTDPNGEIKDASYFYGYLYWTTNGKLGRCIETSADWNTDAVPNWKTLNSCDYHPILVVPKSDLMCVGNSRYVATVNDEGVFINDSLDLFYGWTAKCLTLLKPLLLIGAINNERAELFTWDLESVSYEPIEGWEEKDINAFFKTGGITYLFAGENLYWFNGVSTVPVKALASQVRPGAIDIYKKRMLFGTTKGIFDWGRKNKNYPAVLNSPFIISTGHTENIEIGAILGGSDLYISWKDGSSYGIDTVDPDNKLSQGIYESLLFEGNNYFQGFNIQLFFKKLPANCSIQPKVKLDGQDDWQAIKDEEGNELKADTENSKQMSFPFNERFESAEIRLELNTSGNFTPTVRKVLTALEGVDVIP
jgi:hypothetical protein